MGWTPAGRRPAERQNRYSSRTKAVFPLYGRLPYPVEISPRYQTCSRFSRQLWQIRIQIEIVHVSVFFNIQSRLRSVNCGSGGGFALRDFWFESKWSRP